MIRATPTGISAIVDADGRVVQALGWRDYPVVQGVVLVTAVIFLSINLLVDLLYAVIDPRIRYR